MSVIYVFPLNIHLVPLCLCCRRHLMTNFKPFACNICCCLFFMIAGFAVVVVAGGAVGGGGGGGAAHF